jgi:asparagine synthase (glutamine-hydrolysing)
MCGICGMYGIEDKELLKSMMKVMKYRGPDEEGTFSDKNFCMGMVRLSIIDLSTGKQPIYNEDESLAIVFNGEIYNYLEIRAQLEKKHTFKTDSDTEVIIHAYEEWGVDCLKKLNGMFAFSIYDSNKEFLFIARDRLGIKPLYYTHDTENDQFFYASEIKCLLQNQDIKKDLDPDALNQYLSYRFVLGEKTILKNVKRLQPGHFLTINKGILKIQKYWDISLKNQSDNVAKAKKEVHDELKDAVERRLISDVPLGALLSGGLDSSAIVAMMKEFTENIKTFTIGFEGEPDNEFKQAKLVSDHVGTDHTELTLSSSSLKTLPKIIYHLDEPVGDLTTLPAYQIFKEAKKHVTVMVMGEGSDEIFMGYEQYRLMKATKLYDKAVPSGINKYLIKPSLNLLPKDGAFDKLGELLDNVKDPQNRYYQLTTIFNDKEKHDLLKPETINQFAYLHDDYKILTKYFQNPDNKDHKQNELNSVMHFELKNWLVSDILTRSDRMTMAHSMEGRVPFMDHKVVEAAMRIHPKLKLKGNNEKLILKQAVSHLLPKEIIKRKKQRFFTPIDHFFGGEFKELTKQTLLESKFINGICKKGYIDKLLNYQDNLSYKLILKRHKLTSQYYARQLWSLLVLDQWHDIFVNDKKV